MIRYRSAGHGIVAGGLVVPREAQLYRYYIDADSGSVL